MDKIQKCLKVLEESFIQPAEGDRCVMFAALYNRLKDPKLMQERQKRPQRTRVIHKTLEKDFGIKGLPKWGATAVRGDLMDNKEHIRKFIDAVNELEISEISKAWDICCNAYKQYMEATYVPIQLNPEDTLLDVIKMLIWKPSGGRVQQPLCSAVAEKFYSLLGKEYEVKTKRVFAGDSQSKANGDVQIFKNDKLVCALEVKAHKVDNAKLMDVMLDHGQHKYCLIVLGESFHKDVAIRENFALCTINDYVVSTLSHISAIEGVSLEKVAREIIDCYNNIVIDIENRAELSVNLPTK